MKPREINAVLSIDFDGTLVDSSSSRPIHGKLASAISILADNGALWVVNTGRTVAYTMEGFVRHGIRDLPHFLIARERELYRRNEHKRWIDHGNWNRRCQTAHVKLFKKSRGILDSVRDYVKTETSADFIENAEEPCGIIASTDDEMARICEFIRTLIPDSTDLHYERNSIYLRFSHRAFTKGSSLRELTQSLEVDRSRVFAVGDSFNDLTKLHPSVAGMIACPSNAVDEVKAHVARHGGYIASLPAGEGVLEALRHFSALGALPSLEENAHLPGQGDSKVGSREKLKTGR